MVNEIFKVNMKTELINEEIRRRELINTTLSLLAIVSQRLNESVELMHKNQDKFHYSIIRSDSFADVTESRSHEMNEMIENPMITIEEIANASEGLEIISEGLHNLIRTFTKSKQSC